jgi:hypothetical protein
MGRRTSSLTTPRRSAGAKGGQAVLPLVAPPRPLRMLLPMKLLTPRSMRLLTPLSIRLPTPLPMALLGMTLLRHQSPHMNPQPIHIPSPPATIKLAHSLLAITQLCNALAFPSR